MGVGVGTAGDEVADFDVAAACDELGAALDAGRKRGVRRGVGRAVVFCASATPALGRQQSP